MYSFDMRTGIGVSCVYFNPGVDRSPVLDSSRVGAVLIEYSLGSSNLFVMVTVYDGTFPWKIQMQMRERTKLG